MKIENNSYNITIDQDNWSIVENLMSETGLTRSMALRWIISEWEKMKKKEGKREN